MKNVQVIDGAANCTYSIFAADDDEFEQIFVEGRDVEFADDLSARLGEAQVAVVLSALWGRPVDKKAAIGIHGTLFFELPTKKRFYPTRKESEMVPRSSYSSRQLDAMNRRP